MSIRHLHGKGPTNASQSYSGSGSSLRFALSSSSYPTYLCSAWPCHTRTVSIGRRIALGQEADSRTAGRRMTTCSAQTVWQYLPRLNTVYTIICYGGSAFFYSAVYIWSRSAKDNFGLVDEGKAWDRSKLNERPLYFYSMLLELAVVQSFVHIYRDYGRIKLPANATGEERSKRTVLKRRLLPMLNDVLTRMILFIIFGNAVYFLFIRMRAWGFAYPFAKFQDPSIKDMRPRAANFIGLSVRVFAQGFLLSLLWEFANVALSVYLAKQPLKRQKDQTMQPITNDSKDPNGSLLNGLTLKKDLLRVSQNFNTVGFD